MEPYNFSYKGFSTIIDQVVIDSRRISSKNALFVALRGLSFDGHSFIHEAYAKGCRLALVANDFHDDSLPNDLHIIHVENTLRALQELAASYIQTMPAQRVVISGSYGKTMVKDLLYELISDEIPTFSSPESFNSQLGVALSLLQVRKSDRVALIETGVSQVGEMDFHMKMVGAHAAILTNIGTAHIDTLHNRHTIAFEKSKIIHNSSWALIPNDPLLADLKNKNVYFWDTQHPLLPYVTSSESSYTVHFPSSKTYSGAIKEGLSYAFDLISIAVRAASLLNVSEEAIIRGLTRYQPEPMRIEQFKTSNNATIINDTYVADPMSCDIALQQFPKNLEKGARKLFFFGGLRNPSKDPLRDMERVAHAAAKHKVDSVIIAPYEHQELLSRALATISPTTKVLLASNEKESLQHIREQLHSGDVLIIKSGRKKPITSWIRDIEDNVPNNQVVINLATLKSNIEEIRRIAGSKRIMVMVKALAYGTDDVLLSQFLARAGIDILGVSYVEEGVALRRAGISQDVFVINATKDEAKKAVTYNLEIGVSEPSLIKALEQEASEQNKTIKVHLHVDTGMTRLGCHAHDIESLAQLIAASPHLVFQGIFSHCAVADDPNEDAFTLSQLKRFEEACKKVHALKLYPPYLHIANSSVALRFPSPLANMVRIGIAVYGFHEHESLRPAVSLVSRIVGFNECQKGDTVSYGRTHTISQEKARIAVLPLGYYDGLHRNYSGKHYVLIRGKKAQMVGRICMDYMMCDVTAIPEAAIGDEVLIFGEDARGNYASPHDLACAGNSIVYELMTCLGPRIQRLFIYDEALRCHT